jgi:UDP-N-acetylglucosamine--N-acetylmuramyl-(pentapeptide) pyrophosphoryl-undecaprenol N-acetylglucosamine transferase
MTPPWLVVAGGGTAGHVLPAIAVADTLHARGVPKSSILFVGSERGVERRLVPAAGYGLTMLAGRGLLRSTRPKAVLTNLRSASGLASATIKTLVSFARHRPAVVLSVGGYASVPAAVAARLTRVPIVLAESNAIAGRSVRAFARSAKATAVAFEGTGLPRAVLTGNPVRQEIVELAARGEAARADARRALELDANSLVVTVFGGSLGARRINEAVLGACDLWANDGRSLIIHHVVGERDLTWATDRRNAWQGEHPNASLRYEQVAYEDAMPQWYLASDVVVCRAGATSVADLAVLGVPSILVPLPSAAEDHQTANAREAAQGDAAVVVVDAELTGSRLAHEIDALLGDPDRRRAMADAQRRRGRPGAGEAVADLVVKHARRPPPLAVDGALV